METAVNPAEDSLDAGYGIMRVLRDWRFTHIDIADVDMPHANWIRQRFQELRPKLGSREAKSQAEAEWIAMALKSFYAEQDDKKRLASSTFFKPKKKS